MAVIENDVIKVTVSNSSTKNVIKVSPGVSALSSVSLSINELNDVNTSGITNGQTIVYENGSFVAGDAGAVKTVNDTNPDVDGNVDVSLSSLPDTSISNPADNDYLKYLNNRWVNDQIDISDVTGLQSSLDGKASTSSVPQSLNDLSDVTIAGTPASNQALIFDGTSGVFKSLPSFTNRFVDEAENNKQSIVPFAERVYTVKSDGDGIFIDPDPDTPSAGKVIKRKIYHKTGFLESGAVIGDFTLIHTFADDTAYSATESTFEGFRDGDTYGTPPFTLIQTWEEVTAAPSFTGLLNEAYGSGAEAAYSTRRLNGNYSGDCMTIRRADGTTQSIGFVGEEIDESAIETFCSGSSCTVQVWRDQSGNGNDAEQPTPANQPTIYTGGQLVKDGGRLALDFDGTDDTFDGTWSIGTTSEFAAFHIVNPTNNNSRRYLYDLRDANDDGIRLLLFEDGTLFFSVDTGDERSTSFNAGQQLMFQNYASSTISVGIDGATANTASAPASTSATQNAALYRETAVADRYYFLGKAQEAIFYLSDKSSVRTDIEGNISAYFQSAKLLDEQFGEGAEAAYSTRQLRRDQTDCMVIRRASGTPATTTIGFDSEGNIDEAAINTFCSGTSCTVYQWRDQSGNGNHATAASTGDEPTIYTGGALVKENGKVAVDFASNRLQANVSGTLTAQTVAVVATTGSAASWQRILSQSTSSQEDSLNYIPVLRNSNTNLITGRDGGNKGGLMPILYDEQFLFSALNTGSALTNFLNGISNTTTNYSFSESVDLLSLGNGTTTSDDRPLNGVIQEAVVYHSAKSTTDLNSIEENIGDYFTQNTPLLDTYSGAAAAYSLRKLNSSYTGAAIEVYAGTNGTADIGFNVFGELDTVALAAHCGSNDGFVSKFYDQSGNSNDAAQATTANMPKIYDGTTGVVTENGKPAVEFDGSNDTLRCTTAFTEVSYISAVYENNDTGVYKTILGADATTTLYGSFYFQSSNTPTRTGGFARKSATTPASDYEATMPSSVALGTQILQTGYISGTTIAIAQNGSLQTSTINTSDLTVIGGQQSGSAQIGAGYYNNNVVDFANIKLQEIVVYDSDQSSNRANIEDNINTFYDIY